MVWEAMKEQGRMGKERNTAVEDKKDHTRASWECNRVFQEVTEKSIGQNV